MQICKVNNCEQPIASRETGLCHKHHLRLLRHGTTETTRELVDKSKPCTESGCERNSQTTKGLCLKHYKAWKRKHDKPTGKCSVCSKDIGSGWGGMCSRHAKSKQKYGDPNKVDINARRKFEPYGNQGFKYLKDPDGRWTHRVVAEEVAGRKLRRGEAVHHINGDKLDNRKINILVCESGAQHLSVHRQLESIAMRLVRGGYIYFEDGEYKTDLE